MKNIYIYSLVFHCIFYFWIVLPLAAQVKGTDDDAFIVEIKSPASIARVIEHGSDPGVCQWVGQSGWGANIVDDLCGEVVWTDDSLACGPLTNGAALNGKIALIRRGACSFSLKTYYAQQAGAIAVIILNHYDISQDGPCTTYSNGIEFLNNMPGLDSASAVHIPAIFLERATGEVLDYALQTGQTVEVCFSQLRMLRPTSASMYATPGSQLKPMSAVSVIYNNRSGVTQTDVHLKAEFFNPSGMSESSVTYTMPVVAPDVDSLVVFPQVTIPFVFGKHTVRFTNDQFAESRDTVYCYFEHTYYTFGTDNLNLLPGGVGPMDLDFPGAGYFIQSGGLVLTGDNTAVITYATFGISNIEQVYVNGDPGANIIGIAIYKADVEGDGIGNLSTGFIDDLGGGLISYQEYVMTGNEQNDVLIHVPVIDLVTNHSPLLLEPNNVYYVSLIYDGSAAGNGSCVRFSKTRKVNYFSSPGYPTTPLFFAQLYPEGWPGSEVIQRLQLEGFSPNLKTHEPKTLDDAKMLITPNPASDMVQLKLELDAVNPSVAVSVLDSKGRTVIPSQVEKQFRSGVMHFNISNLPSGVYYLWVRSAEGSAMKRIIK